MMWSWRVRFARSTSDASVVDLPEPVGPGDEHEAARERGEVRHRRRDAQRLERLDLERDHAEGGTDGVALAVDVDAEAGATGQRVGEVELELLLELQPLRLGEDRVDDALQHRRGEHLEVVEGHELAAHADGRLRRGGEVQVGRASVEHGRERVDEGEVLLAQRLLGGLPPVVRRAVAGEGRRRVRVHRRVVDRAADGPGSGTELGGQPRRVGGWRCERRRRVDGRELRLGHGSGGGAGACGSGAKDSG